MKKQYVVLVADRNPRIRNFIQRELTSEGYRVFTAENAGQLKSWIIRPVQLDALVIDPNMPGIDSREQIQTVLSLRPALPVVIHCLSPDFTELRNLTKRNVFVEKSGHSVDLVKKQIELLLVQPVAL
ncbi:MAG: response regulator [Desulfobacteraceae bacterium]|jgi:DNA-binding NtrC family response regulator